MVRYSVGMENIPNKKSGFVLPLIGALVLIVFVVGGGFLADLRVRGSHPDRRAGYHRPLRVRHPAFQGGPRFLGPGRRLPRAPAQLGEEEERNLSCPSHFTPPQDTQK